MANHEELTFDGYIFANSQDLELAKNEVKKISYLESHADMTDMAMIEQIYNKALENRSFSTPVGLEYMKELQRVLENGGVPAERIKPIPLYTTFRRIDLSKTEPVKRRATKVEKDKQSVENKYKNSLVIIGILATMVIVMLFITFNGSTPNAINYRQAIQNEYASWADELTEREAAVREKERELNIEYGE